jgi:P4 family phage/plasmid primase-like protien
MKGSVLFMHLNTIRFNGEDTYTLLALEVEFGADSPQVAAFEAECQARYAQEALAKAAPIAKPARSVPAHIEEPVKPKLTNDAQAAALFEDERLTAHIAACMPIVAAELPRLMAVTPMLELRCIHPEDENVKVYSGVFDNGEAAGMAALAINMMGYNVNYLLNACTPEVTITNALHTGASVKNGDIARRVQIMLDVDPEKDEGENAATDAQLGYAEDVTVSALTELRDQYGIPMPFMHYSGNGVQSIWLTGLSVNDETDRLIQTFLRVCGKYSIKGKAKVDVGVHSRNQHAKFPGTYSRKGTDTLERPQRMARRLDSLRGLVADEHPFLTQAMLERVIEGNRAYLDSLHRRQTEVLFNLSATRGNCRTGAEAREIAQEFCDAFGMEVTREENHGESVIWRLDRCLFQEEREGRNHKNKTNHAFLQIWVKGPEEGKIGAGCHRTDCRSDIDSAGLGAWEYLKRLADPDYAERARAWDRKREQYQHDHAVEERFYAHAKEQRATEDTPKFTEADIFDPEEKTDNPLDALTFTKEFTHVAYDDASNALRVAEHYGQYVRFVRPSTGLMLWKGDVWRPNSAKLVRAYAWEITVKELTWVEEALAEAETIKDAKEREAKMGVLSTKRGQIIASRGRNRLDACVDLVSSLPHLLCQEEEIDAKPFYFNVPHNTLHLDAKDFRAYHPDPADLLTKQSSVKYDPKATCPTWEAFIATIMQHGHEKMAYLQRWCGYALTGDIGEKAFCVLLGEPDTGKTTFVNVLMDIMGEYGVTARIQTFLAKRAEALTNDVARLARARVVSTSEANEHHVFSEEFVKLITGGSRVTARFLHQEEFEFIPQFKLFFDTNVMPRINTEDQALWDRMKVMKFEQKFVRHALVGFGDALPMDGSLKYKLHAERSGILNWFLRGFDLWREQGLNTPEIIEAETRQQREASDKYAPFLKECCLPMGRCKTEDLYKVYVHWCKTAENVHDRYVPTREKFTAAIRNRGYLKKADGKSQCFYALCIKPSLLAQLQMPWYGLAHAEQGAKDLEAAAHLRDE